MTGAGQAEEDASHQPFPAVFTLLVRVARIVVPTHAREGRSSAFRPSYHFGVVNRALPCRSLDHFSGVLEVPEAAGNLVPVQASRLPSLLVPEFDRGHPRIVADQAEHAVAVACTLAALRDLPLGVPGSFRVVTSSRWREDRRPHVWRVVEKASLTFHDSRPHNDLIPLLVRLHDGRMGLVAELCLLPLDRGADRFEGLFAVGMLDRIEDVLE